ncbi:hypothetical protein WIS52_27880 [Pseudonocardia nematodicida]|uniref:DUF3040 domain-containing protein n=1 Tax=Pseudonocardia nematodicida TaxID=1206997 RepID=A0ABV1KIM9_9PSEU
MSVTPPPVPPPPQQPAGGGPEPDPEPRPSAEPLNRREEQSLSGLEDELRRSAPELETEMSSLEAARRTRTDNDRLNRILQAFAITVIVLVLLPSDWVASILSFGLLLGIPLVMAFIAARARREHTTGEGDDRPSRYDGRSEGGEPGEDPDRKG